MKCNKISAIFFDVDGTTYQHNIHDVPASTYYALEQLKEKGIKLAISTSRVKGEMIHIPERFMRLMDGIICSGGALIEEGGKILKQYTIDKSDAQRVLSYCKDNGIVVRWASNGMDCCFDDHEDEEHSAIFDYLYLMRPIKQPYQDETLIHLLFYPPMDQEKQIRDMLQNSNLVCLRRAMEVTACGISKASAITELANHWNIPIEETMAFGDGYNDIEMLKRAHIGVAMGNGADVVKQAADYVTDNIECDGLYHALVYFGLIEPAFEFSNSQTK